MKVPRCTEGGDAPVWQGVTREHTGSYRQYSMSNAARRDGSAAENVKLFLTGPLGGIIAVFPRDNPTGPLGGIIAVFPRDNPEEEGP